MGNNAYLQKRAMRDDSVFRIAERTTEQFMTDTLQITLHRELGWGFDRISRLCKAWVESQKEFDPALNPTSDVEADVKQEHMDRILARIVKGKMELIPFGKRYPELKKIVYNGRKRR